MVCRNVNSRGISPAAQNARKLAAAEDRPVDAATPPEIARLASRVRPAGIVELTRRPGRLGCRWNPGAAARLKRDP